MRACVRASMRAISLETEDTIADNEIIEANLQCLVVSVADQLNVSSILGFRSALASAHSPETFDRRCPADSNLALCPSLIMSFFVGAYPGAPAHIKFLHPETHMHTRHAHHVAQKYPCVISHTSRSGGRPFPPFALRTLPDERERDLARPSVSPIITE